MDPSAEELFAAASEAFKENAHERAVELYSQVLSLAPDHAAARFNRALAYVSLHKGKLARADVEQLAALDTHLARRADGLFRAAAAGYIDMGVSALTEKRLDDARRCFGHALEIAPEDAEAALGLGIVETASGRPAAALEAFDAAVRLDPTSAKALVNRAFLHAQEGRHAQAIQDWERVLVLEPTNDDAPAGLARAWHARGREHFQAQRFEAAASAFREAIRHAPRRAGFQAALGLCLERQDRVEEALAAFAAALELDGRSAEALFNRGWLYLKRGHGALAAADFARYLELRPDDHEAEELRAKAERLTPAPRA